MPESPPTQPARLAPERRRHQDPGAIEQQNREESYPAGDQEPTASIDEANDSILDNFRSPRIATVAAEQARAEQQQAQHPARQENRDPASPNPREKAAGP